MEDRYPKREHKVQPEISFEVKNWTVHHPLYPERIVDDNVSFHVHKGEVVGFSGLQGAGRELAMSIFGRSYGTGISGEVYLNGKKVNLRNTEDAIRHKLAYVTEDRKTNGLILGETIRFNTTLARLDKVCSGGIIDRDKEVKVAEDIKNEMGTKTPLSSTSATCPAATSRRRCWASGCSLSPTCSFWMSPPAASTWAPSTTSTASLTTWSAGASRW